MAQGIKVRIFLWMNEYIFLIVSFMCPELLEKGYNEKGFYVSTMLKYFDKDSKSKDPQDVPYCNWLVVFIMLSFFVVGYET